ncbi:MAG: aconitate hydratase, partial [Coriobacteriia bacterium]|nr:aconitate hydratase [Coriobacteriia bacterium]
VSAEANVYDAFVIKPPVLGADDQQPELIMGPNIKPFPRGRAVSEADGVSATVVLVTGDNITTDDIMPSDSRLLPYRSNIPYLAEYCFEKIDPDFPARAKTAQASSIGGGVIIGGENYGQGSSREHAVLAPLYLGIRMVLAKSFARIHRANLINSGILPLVFADPSEASGIAVDDILTFVDAHTQLLGFEGDTEAKGLMVLNETQNKSYEMIHDLSVEECQVLLAGGRISER